MSSNETLNDWTSDWFFDRARAYPLLTREEEHAIDKAKWQSLDNVFRLLVEDPAGRILLQQWAAQLLHSPPTLSLFKDRKHYFTLRRDHKPIVENDKSSLTLEDMANGDIDGLDTQVARAEFLRGSLIPIGLAKLLLDCPGANETSAALRHWRDLNKPPCSPVPAPEQQTADSLRRAIDAYFESRSRLVNHNLRLVFSIARKLEGRQSFEDLCQDGFIGLIRAAEKYSYHTGHRFSTYAYNWIMQTCRRGDEEMGALIRFPSNIKDQMTAIVRERVRLTQQQGAVPSRHQLAARLDMDLEALEEVMALGNRSVSTDTPIAGDDSSIRLGDTLISDSLGTPEYDTGTTDLQALIGQRLDSLRPIERQVVTRRWGLDRGPVSTRKQLASQLSVSVEWIRQVENTALKKLRSDQALLEARGDFLDS